LNTLHLLAILTDYHKPVPYYKLITGNRFWSKGDNDEIKQYMKVNIHTAFQVEDSVPIPIPKEKQKTLVFTEEFSKDFTK
jgi:hypothetical protein